MFQIFPIATTNFVKSKSVSNKSCHIPGAQSYYEPEGGWFLPINSEIRVGSPNFEHKIGWTHFKRPFWIETLIEVLLIGIRKSGFPS